MDLKQHQLFFLIFFSSLITSSWQTTCFNPKGEVAQNASPCTTNEVSHCCSDWDVCVGDTLCLSQYGTLFSEYCTSQDFSKTGCPKYCIDAIVNNGTSGDVPTCGYSDSAGAWEFCCGINCCNSTDSPKFFIGNTTNIYEDRLQCAALGIPTSSTASTSGTATPTGCATQSSELDNGTSSNNTKDKVHIGIGLGVGLGVPLLLSLALLVWEWRKRVRAEKQLVEVMAGTVTDRKYVSAVPYHAHDAPVLPTELSSHHISEMGARSD